MNVCTYIKRSKRKFWVDKYSGDEYHNLFSIIKIK